MSQSTTPPAPYPTLATGEGIATVTLHPARGTSLPVSLVLLRELEHRLLEVEDAAAHGELRILLIRTAPSHPALTGYDLDEIRALTGPGIFDWSQRAQAILRQIEQLTIPTVAVIRSDWTGGAAELALACSHRVASPDARLALPQTRRGLVPAWGGTVRLPRLIGLHRALRLILAGEPVGAKDALEIGLVDQLIPVAEFEERLEKYSAGVAAAAAAAARPRARRKRAVTRRLVEDTAPGRRLLAARASRRYLRDAASPTLAARLALELMIESSALPLTEAFDRESRVAGELIITSETRGRLHSELVTEQAARSSPGGRPADDTDSAAVVGAGETGSDLAYLLLRAGGAVRIKDNREAARTGVARARARMAWDVRQGRLKEDDGKRRSAMVEGVSGFGGFGVLDVAVLAPDGTSYRARELAPNVESHVREDCLIALHDWSSPPEELAGSLTRPDRFIGISPAFPVDRFPLLEIIPTAATSPDTIAQARGLAQKCGVTPVEVRGPGPTPGVRLLSVFLSEATRLLGTGASVETIDSAIEDFGFFVGPFRRMDAIGTARVQRMLTRVEEVLGERVRPGPALAEIAAAGGTFYRYRGGRPAGPNPQLPAATVEGEGDEVSLQIRRRILLLLINEAARILEEGGVDDAADLDLISILALGFPREHGGLLFYAQTTGLAGIAEDLRSEEGLEGGDRAPARLLDQLAAEDRGFFPDPETRSGHDPDAVLK